MFNNTSCSSSSLPHKLEDRIKCKLGKYLDDFVSAVRTGEFVVQTKLSSVPTIGLKVIKTGKFLKFPLEEDEVSIEELTASEFEIKNNDEWVKLEASIADEVGFRFGLSDARISASLKKLVIQKSGSTFPTNLDELFNRSDNASPSNYFGHLVIQLPSHYTGGHFRFEHEKMLQEFDMSVSMDTKEGWTAQYLAYYHKLEQNHGEILSGVRSCLIYSLEIESTDAPSKLPPRAPTISTIVPSFFQIIQEWKSRSDKTSKLFTCSCSGIKPYVISTFLGQTLRDNGLTLFYGRSGTLSDFASSSGSVDHKVIIKLRLLASPDDQVEEAFASFLRDEPDNYNDFGGTSSNEPDEIDDRGLKFYLVRHEIAPGKDHHSDKFVLFLSGDGNLDLFKNESWINDMQFWRFQSYLFLKKFENFDKNPTARATLLQAADSLVSLEIDHGRGEDLFPNLTHFENLLNKFLFLDDTLLLIKLLQVCTEFQSNFDTLFPVLLKSRMPWPMLQFGLANLFHPIRVRNEYTFYAKVTKFISHIENVFHMRDKNCEDFYFDVFDSILQKFQELRNAEEFVDSRNVDLHVVIDLLRISEVMQYNLFNFMKSQPAKFVREVVALSCALGPLLGVMWVTLVTDLYCCTKLLDNWPNQRVEKELPQEDLFLALFFQLAEEVGADVKGILGNVKKYGVIVQALSHAASLNGIESKPETEVLPKFWVPFATRLEARLEAVMNPDVDGRTRQKCANLSVHEEMLQEIRKLLERAKQQCMT